MVPPDHSFPPFYYGFPDHIPWTVRMRRVSNSTVGRAISVDHSLIHQNDENRAEEMVCGKVGLTVPEDAARPA